MRKFLGWTAFLVASWMFVSPQAPIGLKELQWMYQYAFPGEVLPAVFVIAIAYYLLDLQRGKKGAAAKGDRSHSG